MFVYGGRIPGRYLSRPGVGGNGPPTTVSLKTTCPSLSNRSFGRRRQVFRERFDRYPN